MTPRHERSEEASPRATLVRVLELSTRSQGMGLPAVGVEEFAATAAGVGDAGGGFDDEATAVEVEFEGAFEVSGFDPEEEAEFGGAGTRFS